MLAVRLAIGKEPIALWCRWLSAPLRMGSPQLPPPWPFPIATETLLEANIPGVTSSR